MSDFAGRIRKSVQAARASATYQRDAQRREDEEETRRQTQNRQRASAVPGLMWEWIRAAEPAGDGTSVMHGARPRPDWEAGWARRSWQVVLVALIALMLVVSVVVSRSWASGIEARIAQATEQQRETRCQDAREQFQRAGAVLPDPATTELYAARLEAQLQTYDATRNVAQYCR